MRGARHKGFGTEEDSGNWNQIADVPGQQHLWNLSERPVLGAGSMIKHPDKVKAFTRPLPWTGRIGACNLVCNRWNQLVFPRDWKKSFQPFSNWQPRTSNSSNQVGSRA